MSRVGDNGFIERYFDSGLTLPSHLDRGIISKQEVERILRRLSIVTLAEAIPRRLGADAGPRELADDKQRARRVRYALEKSLGSWDRRHSRLPLDDEIRLNAVHLIWEAWGPSHLTEILGSMRFVATYAVRFDDVKWSNQALHRLDNEHRWVDYALR